MLSVLSFRVIRQSQSWSLAEKPAAAEVEGGGDDERMIVGATEQLVLRCGKAGVTLTKGGRALIPGSRVSSRATGVNELRAPRLS
jgi:hypothetical protein